MHFFPLLKKPAKFQRCSLEVRLDTSQSALNSGTRLCRKDLDHLPTTVGRIFLLTQSWQLAGFSLFVRSNLARSRALPF